MKNEEITVANLKCNGCASTIRKELLKLEGIETVDVDMDKDSIKVFCEDSKRKEIIDKLHSLGYPEATLENGLLLQLKSYVSCMIGRVNNLK